MTLPYVNVPQVPGVPPVNFAPLVVTSASSLFSLDKSILGGPDLLTGPGVNATPQVSGYVTPALLTQDLVSQFSAIFGPQWGIFLGGSAVITAESVKGFEFRNDWTISDYPIEGGTFQSYDKVLQPFLAKVKFASGASPDTRESLLASIKAAAASLNVYDVVTPEFIYMSCSISHYDYRRTNNQGVGLIVIDVWLSQILQQQGGGLTNTQNPASKDAVNNGTQNAVPLPTANPFTSVPTPTPNPFVNTGGGSNPVFDIT